MASAGGHTVPQTPSDLPLAVAPWYRLSRYAALRICSKLKIDRFVVSDPHLLQTTILHSLRADFKQAEKWVSHPKIIHTNTIKLCAVFATTLEGHRKEELFP